MRHAVKPASLGPLTCANIAPVTPVSLARYRPRSGATRLLTRQNDDAATAATALSVQCRVNIMLGFHVGRRDHGLDTADVLRTSADISNVREMGFKCPAA